MGPVHRVEALHRRDIGGRRRRRSFRRFGDELRDGLVACLPLQVEDAAVVEDALGKQRAGVGGGARSAGRRWTRGATPGRAGPRGGAA